MPSIIVAAPPFTGELAPLLEITRGLVRRRHAVTLTTGSRFEAEVRATGAAFVPRAARPTSMTAGSPSSSPRPRGRPVVVVTQGTLANDDLHQLVRPTLDALAGDDVLVVAALGGRSAEALPGAVPENARIEPFIPFGHLLPRADVLVTNGGFGGTQQALAAATPVVVAGATEDKPFVAARVAAAGVGRDLGTATPEPARVRDAVLGVLADPAVRRSTASLAAEYAGYDVVEGVQRLALRS